jgi:hypothetical protein
LDEHLGWTAQFAAALDDRRYAPCVEHTFAEMARMRIYGILADYEDQQRPRYAAQRSGLQAGGRPGAQRR